MTRLYLVLRLCERFGVDPLGGSALAGMARAMMPPGLEIEQMFAYHRVREAEQAGAVVGGG